MDFCSSHRFLWKGVFFVPWWLFSVTIRSFSGLLLSLIIFHICRCGAKYVDGQMDLVREKKMDRLLFIWLQQMPKEIASVLDISEAGNVFLIYGHDWGNFQVSYYTCKDQRICFMARWQQFATLHNIGDGSVVLILFHKDNDGRLIVPLYVL